MARKQLKRFRKVHYDDFVNKGELIGEPLLFLEMTEFETEQYGKSVSIICQKVDANDEPIGDRFPIAAKIDSALAKQVAGALQAEPAGPFVAMLKKTWSGKNREYFELDDGTEEE